MNHAYLLLGSNIESRMFYIKQAIDNIHFKIGEIIKYSKVYETEPWGFSDNTYFLNQVLIVETQFNPQQLLAALKDIELRLGRTKTANYSSRTIDIDILFFDDIIVSDENLIIPHPHICNRMFSLIPLSEVAPDFIHPVLKKNLVCLTEDCKDKTIVNIYKKENEI